MVIPEWKAWVAMELWRRGIDAGATLSTIEQIDLARTARANARLMRPPSYAVERVAGYARLIDEIEATERAASIDLAAVIGAIRTSRLTPWLLTAAVSGGLWWLGAPQVLIQLAGSVLLGIESISGGDKMDWSQLAPLSQPLLAVLSVPILALSRWLVSLRGDRIQGRGFALIAMALGLVGGYISGMDAETMAKLISELIAGAVSIGLAALGVHKGAKMIAGREAKEPVG